MTSGVPRYTDKPFPPYRFRPGRHPHPHSLGGHSYAPPDPPGPPATLTPPESWLKNSAYLFGCDLYNQGYWWEAHEEWEGIWQLTDKTGVQGRFLQGLIQVAAAHLKLEIGHLRGVNDLLGKSGGHLGWVLQRVGDGRYMGLSLAQWWAEVQGYFAAQLDVTGPPVHDWSRYPAIHLAAGASATDAG